MLSIIIHHSVTPFQLEQGLTRHRASDVKPPHQAIQALAVRLTKQAIRTRDSAQSGQTYQQSWKTTRFGQRFQISWKSGV